MARSLLLLIVPLLCWLGFEHSTADVRHHAPGDDNFVISTASDGTYNLTVKNSALALVSAPAYFNVFNKTFSTADGTLKLNVSTGTSGHDKLGQWQAISFVYRTTSNPVVQITASIITYPLLDLPIVIFRQTFDNGADWTQASTVEGLCGGFPGFMIEGPPGILGYLSYGGLMVGDTNKHIGTWYYQATNINDGITGGPLAIFDRQGNTFVISPFNNFMSASFLHDKNVGGNFYGGIMGGVSHIPAGYHQDYIVYYARGINKAFDGWGQLLRGYYGKDVSVQKQDLTINYLGYWTDNGAYYYYLTEPNKTYEQTVYDVTASNQRMNIPYKYFQYDSWWYYKGKGNGVKTWTARPDIFPDGFQNVTNKIKLPAAAHNRYWSSDTTYAKQNGGKYDFIVERSKALPLTEKFWLDLFTDAKEWGLIMYEQDWLNVEFSGLDALLHNLSLGSDWLTNMAKAAEEKEIFIQYCMSNPRHAMQSLLYSSVTQARVSNDYNPGGNNWNIGISSILAAALGLAPYKDTFWTTEKQPGNKYGRSEPNWKLNTVVSVLSTGPVGPSDMIGATNVPMLMKCCNSDGLILKPQYPARAIDAQIMQAAFGDVNGPDGEVWISYTDISGLRFANVLALNLASGTSYTLHPNDTGIFENATGSDLFAVPYDEPAGWVSFSFVNGLTFTDKFKPSRICLYHISTAIPGWSQTAILGELEKWVPMSPQRVLDIQITADAVVTHLAGAPGETFDFWYIMGTKGDSVMCKLSSTGSGVFLMNKTLQVATCGPPP